MLAGETSSELPLCSRRDVTSRRTQSDRLMTRIDTLFFDVGGVCLTNGWDTDARLAAASHFVLDVEETEDRHQALADGFERGELSLDAYLDHVSFIASALCRETPSSHSCAPDRSRIAHR